MAAVAVYAAREAEKQRKEDIRIEGERIDNAYEEAKEALAVEKPKSMADMLAALKLQREKEEHERGGTLALDEKVTDGLDALSRPEPAHAVCGPSGRIYHDKTFNLLRPASSGGGFVGSRKYRWLPGGSSGISTPSMI